MQFYIDNDYKRPIKKWNRYVEDCRNVLTTLRSLIYTNNYGVETNHISADKASFEFGNGVILEVQNLRDQLQVDLFDKKTKKYVLSVCDRTIDKFLCWRAVLNFSGFLQVLDYWENAVDNAVEVPFMGCFDADLDDPELIEVTNSYNRRFQEYPVGKFWDHLMGAVFIQFLICDIREKVIVGTGNGFSTSRSDLELHTNPNIPICSAINAMLKDCPSVANIKFRQRDNTLFILPLRHRKSLNPRIHNKKSMDYIDQGELDYPGLSECINDEFFGQM